MDLEEKIQEIDKDMSECSCDYNKLKDLDFMKRDMEKELEKMISEWENVVELLDGKSK